jgi:hypothetical protein
MQSKEPRQNKLDIWSETSYVTRVAAQSPLEREYGQTDQLISARRLTSQGFALISLRDMGVEGVRSQKPEGAAGD